VRANKDDVVFTVNIFFFLGGGNIIHGQLVTGMYRKNNNDNIPLHADSVNVRFSIPHIYNTSRVMQGKTIVSVLHNVQLLLNKKQQIWGGVYIY